MDALRRRLGAPTSTAVDRAELLRAAAAGGYTAVIHEVLSCPSGVGLDDAAADGTTALMDASEGGHAHAVKLLLERGAAVNALRRDGTGALLTAALGGHAAVVRVRHSVATRAVPTQTRADCAPPLRTVCAQVLLAAGAAPNVAYVQGWTALMWAAKGGHTRAVRVLLEPGQADVAACGDGNTTALHACAANGNAKCMRALLRAPASKFVLNLQDERAWSPLMVAAESGHAAAARTCGAWSLPHATSPSLAHADATEQSDESLVDISAFSGRAAPPSGRTRPLRIRPRGRLQRNALFEPSSPLHSIVTARLSP